MLFASAAPASATSTGTIGVSFGPVIFGILAPTLVTAFAANTFKDGVSTGTAATAKRTGAVTIMLDTEAYI